MWTLAKQATDGQSCDSTQTTRPKTPKWTKIAREVLASNTTPTRRVENGEKKKAQVGETQDGSRKKSRALAKEYESTIVKADD